MGKQVVTIDGLDLFDMISFIGKKNKRYLAIILADVEQIIDKDSKEFEAIRKIFLDGFNDYTRAIVRIVFGDIEYTTITKKNDTS